MSNNTAEQRGVPFLPIPNERAVATWQGIWEKFFHYELNGKLKPMCSLSTLRKKHGPSLRECGVVFKHYDGPNRTPIIMGWPSRIQAWIQYKFENDGGL